MAAMLKTERLEKRTSLESLLSSCGIEKRVASAVADRLCSLSHVRVQFIEIVPASLRLEDDRKAGIVETLVDNGILKPMATSDRRMISGRMVPMRYSLDLTALEDDQSENLSHAIDMLDLRIRQNRPTFFYEHPVLFKEFQSDLELLSKWLGSERTRSRNVTRKERSYEIWGDEKHLTKTHKGSRSLEALLSSDLKLDADALLNTWDTVSPDFVSYILPGEGFVIVSENKDFYSDMEDVLVANGRVDILGKTVRGVITGNGWASGGTKFSDFRTRRNVTANDLLYVGDIDIDGIGILQRFESLFGESMFKEIYELMLSLHIRRREAGLPLNTYSEKQNRSIDIAKITKRIDPNLIDEFADCLESRIRIPQEILTRPILESLISYANK